MTRPFSDDEALNAFLSVPRLAILMINRPNAAPLGVPVWFEWTGSVVRTFCARGAARLRLIEADPEASIVVTNQVGEPEAWVAFDGRLEVAEADVSALIGRLGARYWDLENAQYRETLESWMAARDAFASLTLIPARVRQGA